eukprot:CAMPEP_0170323352 /NCGR_PEP_ID=MMETSP0116_2-20130129/62475_1 /TAXON_ID=400756 /ORGANISM="Durinskia baltica, Strain CSIRO CS-38" /LENGTH=32 /DNA_ID= /DNA_START= /DNA_END= /DNA_ORIENTATION=
MAAQGAATNTMDKLRRKAFRAGRVGALNGLCE